MLLTNCPDFKYAMIYSRSEEIEAVRELFNILSLNCILSFSQLH